MSEFLYGFYMLTEILLRSCIHPRLRAKAMAILGAQIGSNVRIYDCRFINVRNGFSGLKIGDNVHIGCDCLIDLAGAVSIGAGSTLSPRVVVMSHSDPGSSHGSPLCERFPVECNGVIIGENCWIGTSSTLLSGTVIGSHVVVGAASLVRGSLSDDATYGGVPARRLAS